MALIVEKEEIDLYIINFSPPENTNINIILKNKYQDTQMKWSVKTLRYLLFIRVQHSRFYVLFKYVQLIITSDLTMITVRLRGNPLTKSAHIKND